MRAAWNVTSALSLVLLLVLACREARADPVLFDCAQLAAAVGNMADFRDTGGRLELVVRMARDRNRGAPASYLDVIEREIRRLWREQLPRAAAVDSAFKRCRAQLGDMGRDT